MMLLIAYKQRKVSVCPEPSWKGNIFLPVFTIKKRWSGAFSLDVNTSLKVAGLLVCVLVT